ncbi:hypothetical protein [Enterococcus faecalis]|uniref:hypothetical protein n=1 Tax=Enterococcus faecalis TaxID=1351 RepID=UPI0025B05740|nr:hypothetical protein [Enterococcus faecalis]MDN3185193.1 hypothetical protein [Enterococcus faecalis]
MNEVVEINLLTNEVTVRDIESNEKSVEVFTDARARELYEDFTQNGNDIKEVTVGKYQGFDVTIRKSSLATYSLYLEGNYSYGTSLSLTSPIGTIQRMENIEPERQLKNRENELAELAHQKEQYKAQHNQLFEQEEKLKQQKAQRNEYGFDR